MFYLIVVVVELRVARSECMGTLVGRLGMTIVEIICVIIETVITNW